MADQGGVHELDECSTSLHSLLGGQRPVKCGQRWHERGQQGPADDKAFEGHSESEFGLAKMLCYGAMSSLSSSDGLGEGERQ